jgi:hypothetical protein
MASSRNSIFVHPGGGVFRALLAVLPIFSKAGNDPSKDGEKECGKAVISIAAKDNPDGIEKGAIIFDFQGVGGAEGGCKL